METKAHVRIPLVASSTVICCEAFPYKIDSEEDFCQYPFGFANAAYQLLCKLRLSLFGTCFGLWLIRREPLIQSILLREARRLINNASDTFYVSAVAEIVYAE